MIFDKFFLPALKKSSAQKTETGRMMNSTEEKFFFDSIFSPNYIRSLYLTVISPIWLSRAILFNETRSSLKENLSHTHAPIKIVDFLLIILEWKYIVRGEWHCNVDIRNFIEQVVSNGLHLHFIMDIYAIDIKFTSFFLCFTIWYANKWRKI